MTWEISCLHLYVNTRRVTVNVGYKSCQLHEYFMSYAKFVLMLVTTMVNIVGDIIDLMLVTYMINYVKDMII